MINQTECTSTHEGRELLDTILPTTVDKLFTLLFRNSTFLHDSHAYDWQIDETGKKFRIIKLKQVVVGSKLAQATETMDLCEYSKLSGFYAIDTIIVNDNVVPYANDFYVTQHYCMSRTNDNQTKFTVYAQIKYKNLMFGVKKAFIERNLWFGLEEYYASLMAALRSEYSMQSNEINVRRSRAKIIDDEQEGGSEQEDIYTALEKILQNPPRPRRGPGSQTKPIEEDQVIKKGEINVRTEKKNTTKWFIVVLLFCLVIYLALYHF